MDAFHSLSGLQVPAVTAAQMREVEELARTRSPEPEVNRPATGFPG